jgi:Holliday junction resolvasome RuvABC endonuclease subunit
MKRTTKPPNAGTIDKAAWVEAGRKIAKIESDAAYNVANKKFLNRLKDTDATAFANEYFNNPVPNHPQSYPPTHPMSSTHIRVKRYRILALDIATHCGWAVARDLFGVWNLTPKRDESVGMRLIKFRAKVNEIIEAEKINLIVFERPGGQHTGAIIVQSELQGQLKVICEDHHIEYKGYSSQEIKKFATGKGNVGKAAMIEAAQKKLGYTGKDDNEADALWLLELARYEYK